ncbi:MAG TPA: glycosyltransferase [Polyangiaceae bacterium]
MSASRPNLLVVPCYNEEQRLDSAAFVEFARSGRCDLLLVDDGSTDGTARVLAQIEAASPDSANVLSLPRNGGKAEAVRQGLLRGLETGRAIVGYADADLSAPFSELARLLDVAERRQTPVVMGSRVALLGSHIERSRMRHYLGRVFATAASLLLRLPVYDTQCGAKFFRVGPALRAALDMPFHSAWAFDVELLGRLLIGGPGADPLGVHEFLEIPLQEWCDVRGSRMGPFDMLHAGIDLARIGHALSERRQRAHASGTAAVAQNGGTG